jgi:hypothetical protein
VRQFEMMSESKELGRFLVENFLVEKTRQHDIKNILLQYDLTQMLNMYHI